MSIRSTIRRWLRNKPLRTYEWQFSPLYWKLVERWQRTKFALGRRLFMIRGWTRTQGESFAILSEVAKTIATQVLIAIAVVAGLVALGTFIAPHATFLPSLDHETSTTVISVIAQVAGVFLALYFTAISVVISRYARVPGDVRQLLMNEKVGNRYIRIVALTVAIAILLLAKGAFGFLIGPLDLIVVIVLAVVATFSFVLLGMRIFHFFDPSPLARDLGHDLVGWFQAATPKGFRWRNPSFQAHYQKQAEQALVTYANVASFAVRKAGVDGRALRRLVLQALILLQLYVEKKASIPSDSYWFKRTYRQREWLTADYSEISLALSSGTSLEPEAIPDFMWFEKYVGRMIIDVVQALIQRNDLRNAVEILDDIQRTQSALAEHLAIDETLHLFRELRPQVEKVAFGEQSKDGSPAKDEEDGQLVKLGLIDMYCLGLVGILLGFSKTLHETEATSFANRIGKTKLHKPESIHITRVPREVIQQLEYLQKGLEFERAVEGDLVSPVWYRNHIAALGMVRFIQRTVEELVKEWENTFGSQTERLIREKRFLNAIQVIQRGLEACDKFIYHLDTIRACFEGFSTLRRVQDIPWPTPDWDDFTKRVLDVRERLIINVGKSTITLAQMPSKPNWPDYLGQCFSVLAEECNSAMLKGNDKLFEQIFPPFFYATLAAHERLRTQLGSRTDQAAIVYMTEPIEDLLHLSGYALIYTELDGKTYWNITKKLWDSYLGHHTDSKAVIEFIGGAVAYRQSVFAILPRDPIRMSWKQGLGKRLQQDGILTDLSDFEFIHGGGVRPYVPKHPSKVIQIIARGIMGVVSRDPRDVFLGMYIFKRPEASGLTPPRSVEDFLESVERLERSEISDEGLE